MKRFEVIPGTVTEYGGESNGPSDLAPLDLSAICAALNPEALKASKLRHPARKGNTISQEIAARAAAELASGPDATIIPLPVIEPSVPPAGTNWHLQDFLNKLKASLMLVKFIATTLLKFAQTIIAKLCPV
jgi:hypothetical protein